MNLLLLLLLLLSLSSLPPPPTPTHSQQTAAVGSASIEALNSIVSQVQEVLLDFVEVNPEAWAPIISAWAIELLGQISSRYSQQCVRSNATLQDMFQVSCQSWRGWLCGLEGELGRDMKDT